VVAIGVAALALLTVGGAVMFRRRQSRR